MTDASSDKLALLGGTPARSAPFLVEPMVDGEEERLVLEATRDLSIGVVGECRLCRRNRKGAAGR